MNKKLITILGPTAVGKTKLATELAFHFKGEIISADSRQVYKGMDIGTGKDLSDYNINDTKIPYHLIDVISPTEEFNLFLFTQLFNEAIKKISQVDKQPFLVGGTGLYIHSLLMGYDVSKIEFSEKRVTQLNKLSLEQLITVLKNINSSLHNSTDSLEKDRIIKAVIIAEQKEQGKSSKEKIDSIVIGVSAERDVIKKRITSRLKERLKNGMIEEVEMLLKKGVTHEKLKFFGLEYKFISQYLSGNLNYNDLYQKLNSAIHKFAKRQMTWFRKMEREGIIINWVEGSDFEKARDIIKREL